MTPFLARHAAEVAAFAAAVRAGDGATALVMCDWLEEVRATAADVTTLYAAPPEWLCRECGGRLSPSAASLGLPQRMQDFYCLLCSSPCPPASTPPADDDSLGPVLAEWAARHGPPGRAADVRGLACERGASGMAWWVGASRTRGGNLAGVPYNSEPAARRALKRAVLALWPEVRVPCPHPDTATNHLMPRHWGCQFCRGSGTVAPADLIPPEPDAQPPAQLTRVPNEFLSARVRAYSEEERRRVLDAWNLENGP